MKHTTWKRLLALTLGLALAASLAACDEPVEEPTPEEPKRIEEGTKTPEPSAGMSADALASLAELRSYLGTTEQFAAAYLGRRGAEDTDSLTEWLRNNDPALVSVFPFLLEIPEEGILGTSGDLYAIVPRDENASLAVDRMKWETVGNGLAPSVTEVAYRSESGEPVLVFVNYESAPEESDTQINIVGADGTVVTWFPLMNFDTMYIVLPTGADGLPLALDFSFWGQPGEAIGAWLPPTDTGLADTTWQTADDWILELRSGGAAAPYAGEALLYCRVADDGDAVLLYTGGWAVESDSLRLDLTGMDGIDEFGLYPVLIAPSGEELYIQQGWDGALPPFFADGVTSMDMTYCYG